MTDIAVRPSTAELFTFTETHLEGNKLGSGKDAVAYEVADSLVYRQSHHNPHLENPKYTEMIQGSLEREVEVYADLPENVFVSRTLIAWLEAGRTHKIVQKAEGTPIFPQLEPGEWTTISDLKKTWEAAIEVAANVPDKHYKKLIEDEAELRQRGIFMDYAGPSNLLYEPSEGFTIIDAEFESMIPLKGKCMYTTLIGSDTIVSLLGQSPSWEGRISPSARESTISILQRLAALGHQPGYKLLFRYLCEQLDHVPAYATEED